MQLDMVSFARPAESDGYFVESDFQSFQSNGFAKMNHLGLRISYQAQKVTVTE